MHLRLKRGEDMVDPCGATFGAGLCWVLGGRLVSLGVSRGRSWRRIVRNGIPVTGTVAAVEEDDDYDPWLVIEYRVGSAAHRLRVLRHPGAIGDQIALLIDPAAPDKALIRGTEARQLRGFLFLCALGAIICLLGTAPLVSLIADR